MRGQFRLRRPARLIVGTGQPARTSLAPMASITSRPVTGLDRATTAPATPISTRPPLGKGPRRATGGRRGRLACWPGPWPCPWASTASPGISGVSATSSPGGGILLPGEPPSQPDLQRHASTREGRADARDEPSALLRRDPGEDRDEQIPYGTFRREPGFLMRLHRDPGLLQLRLRTGRKSPWPNRPVTGLGPMAESHPEIHHQPARDGPLRVVTGVDRAAIAPQPNSTVVP